MSELKLKFDSTLDYQRTAVASIVRLFSDLPLTDATFSLASGSASQSLFSELGVSNPVPDDTEAFKASVLANLRTVQEQNGIPMSDILDGMHFSVEMETGTGKTYVYLRTIFELNRSYGFTKFVIVVPSVAIKEGVYKTLQITEEHFRGLYANAPFDYFIYDSAKLGQVRNFATSPNIQIMIVTVGAINKKDVNNLYKDSEKTGGEKPIDLIKATRPILIVDEPQSVDGGLEGRGKEA